MKKKRFITLLLSLCLCITSLPCNAFADEIEQITETVTEGESGTDLASASEQESELEPESESESEAVQPDPEEEQEDVSETKDDPDSISAPEKEPDGISTPEETLPDGEPESEPVMDENSQQVSTNEESNEESATIFEEEGSSDETDIAIEYITLTFMTVDEDLIDEVVIEKGGTWSFPDVSDFLPEPGAEFAWYDEDLEEEIVENTSFETDMLIILFYRGDATILIEPCEEGAHDFQYAPADAQDGQNCHRVTCSNCDYSALEACRVDEITAEVVDASTNLVHFHKICELCGQEEIATNEDCSSIYEDNGDGTHDVICYHCNTTYTAPHQFIDERCVVCENVRSDYRYYNTVTYLENYQTYEENPKYMQGLSDYENSLVTLGDKQYLYALLSESPDLDNAASGRRYYAPVVTFANGYNAQGTYQSNLKFDEVYDELGHKLIDKATFTEDTFNTEVDILHLEKQVFPYLIKNSLAFSNGSAYWNLYYFDDTVWAPVASASQIVDYGCPRSYDFSFDVSNGLRVKHNGSYEDFYDYTYSTYRIMYPKIQNHNNVIFDYSTFVRDFIVTDYVYDGDFHTCLTVPSDVNYAQYAWIESDTEFEQIKEQIKNTGTFETEKYYWDYLPKRKWIGKYNYVLKFKLSGMSDTFYLPFTFEIKEQGCTHNYVTEYIRDGINSDWAYLSNWSSYYYPYPIKLERCTKCQNVETFHLLFSLGGLTAAIKKYRQNFNTAGYLSISVNGQEMIDQERLTVTDVDGKELKIDDYYWAKENEKILLTAIPRVSTHAEYQYLNLPATWDQGYYFTSQHYLGYENITLCERMIVPRSMHVGMWGNHPGNQLQVCIQPSAFIRLRAQDYYSYAGIEYPVFIESNVATTFNDAFCAFGEKNAHSVTSGPIYYAKIDEDIYSQTENPLFDYCTIDASLEWTTEEPMITGAGDLYLLMKTTTSVNETFYMPLFLDVAEDSAWVHDFDYFILYYDTQDGKWKKKTKSSYDEHGHTLFTYPYTLTNIKDDMTLDPSQSYIVLNKYNGNASEVVIHATATVNEVEYPVIVGCPNGTFQYGHFYSNGIGGNSIFSDASSVEHVKIERDVIVGHGLANTFYSSNVKSVDLSEVDLSGVKTLYSLFAYTKNLESVDFGGQDLPSLVNIYSIFYKSGIKEIHNMFSAQNIDDFSYAFYECRRLKELDLRSCPIGDGYRNTTLMFEGSGIRKLIISDLGEGNNPSFSTNGFPFYIDQGTHLVPDGDFVEDTYDYRYNSPCYINYSHKTYISTTELIVREYYTDKIIAIQYGYDNYKSDWYFENEDDEVEMKSQEEAIRYFNENYVLYTVDKELFDFDALIPENYFFPTTTRTARNEATVYAIPKTITITPELFITETEYIHDNEIAIEDVITLLTQDYPIESENTLIEMHVSSFGNTFYLGLNYSRTDGVFTIDDMETSQEEIIEYFANRIAYIDNIAFCSSSDDYYFYQNISYSDPDCSSIVYSFDDVMTFESYIYEYSNGTSNYQEFVFSPDDLADFHFPDMFFKKDTWAPARIYHYGLDQISDAVTELKELRLLDYDLSSNNRVNVNYETFTLSDEVLWVNEKAEPINGEVSFDHTSSIFPFLHESCDDPTCEDDGADYYRTDYGVRILDGEYSLPTDKRLAFSATRGIQNCYLTLPVLSDGSYFTISERSTSNNASTERFLIKKNNGIYTVSHNGESTYTEEELTNGAAIQLTFGTYFSNFQIDISNSNTNDNIIAELSSLEIKDTYGNNVPLTTLFAGLYSNLYSSNSLIMSIQDRDTFVNEFTEYVYTNKNTSNLKLAFNLSLYTYIRDNDEIAVTLYSQSRPKTFSSPEDCANYIVNNPQIVSTYGKIEIPYFIANNATFEPFYSTCKSYTIPIPATGHTYDDGVVTLAPTCTEDGVKTFTCQNDSTHTYTEPIPAIGHDWEEDGTIIREATRDEDGIIEYTCKNDPLHTRQETFVFVPEPEYTIIVPALIEYFSIDDAELEDDMLAFFEGAAGMIYFDFAVSGADFKDTTVLHVSVNEPVISVKNDYNEETKLHLLNYYNLSQEEEPQNIFDLCANEEDMTAGLGDVYFCTRNTVFEVPEEEVYADVRNISTYANNVTFAYIVSADAAGDFSGGITLRYQMQEIE